MYIDYRHISAFAKVVSTYYQNKVNIGTTLIDVPAVKLPEDFDTITYEQWAITKNPKDLVQLGFLVIGNQGRSYVAMPYNCGFRFYRVTFTEGSFNISIKHTENIDITAVWSQPNIPNSFGTDSRVLIWSREWSTVEISIEDIRAKFGIPSNISIKITDL
jgi:hypothetical protein